MILLENLRRPPFLKCKDFTRSDPPEKREGSVQPIHQEMQQARLTPRGTLSHKNFDPIAPRFFKARTGQGANNQADALLDCAEAFRDTYANFTVSIFRRRKKTQRPPALCLIRISTRGERGGNFPMRKSIAPNREGRGMDQCLRFEFLKKVTIPLFNFKAHTPI